ncbi:MAG: histidine kinase [Hydrogenophaga sp.]|nr:histidine kinase [Hydrogenophaga sp.]
MKTALAHWLFGWLPADARERTLRRLLVVWGVALAIGLILWGIGARSHPLDIALVYSYAISTAIWFCSDPLRVALHRWLRTEPPHYWAPTLRMAGFMFVSTTIGYAVGTAIGDEYAGRSTWDMIGQSPLRLLGFWVSGMVISGFFVLGFQQRARAEDLRRQATEARLKLLETQLEPHMLFNTLANLRVLIQTDPPRAVAMLDRLNDYLRATLRGSRTDPASGAHTLADECARLNDYLELMAVRMGPRLSFGFELPEELRAHPVPPLLLQPLVENAIRHGLEPRIEGGRIDVRARREGGMLRLDIADTGVGMDPTDEAPLHDGGFGLAQVRERVASLPGGAGRVEVDSRPGAGTTVRLTLPLHPSITA